MRKCKCTQRRWLTITGKLGLAIGIGLVGLSLLLGVPAATASDPKSGGRLVVGFGSNIESLDPFIAGGPSMRVWCNMYEGLIYKTSDGKLEPSLAVSWERIDLLRWRFKLRKGVKFHTGRPLNAKAVAASYAYINNPEKPYSMYEYSKWIAKVTPISEYEIEITTSAPNPDTLMALTDTMAGVIIDVEANKEWGDLKERSAGTGPFMTDKWELGKYVRLKKNPDYWGGAPYLDELEFRFIKEPATRIMALQRREIDLDFETTPEQVDRIEKDSKLKLAKVGAPRVPAFEPNMSRPILGNNPEVRAAISLAIDTYNITKYVIGAKGRPICGTNPGDKCMGYPEYDPEEAKRILEAAGWKMGKDGVRERDGQKLEFGLSFDYLRDYRMREYGEAIQAQCKEVGIKVNLDVLERAGYIDKVVAKGDNDSGFIARVMLQGPAKNLRSIFYSANTKVGSWGIGRHNDPEMDALLDKLQNAPNEKEALKLLNASNKMIQDKHLAIPLLQVNYLFGMQTYVMDFDPHFNEWAQHRYHKTWLDK
jgi:peptide/nickel transport system substrate-binding protein